MYAKTYAQILGVVLILVGLVGIIYLLVGVLGFAVPTMFGLIPHGYTAFDNLLHLVLGGLSLAVAWWFFGAERGARTQNQSGRPGL